MTDLTETPVESGISTDMSPETPAETEKALTVLTRELQDAMRHELDEPQA